MKIVPISITNMTSVLSEPSLIEYIGQIAGECYNSSMDSKACIQRALNCINRGHHSPWEHYNVTLRCTVDRGTSHALVRHRHCAFQQSSTIYQKFNEIVVIGNEEIMSDIDKQFYITAEIRYKQKLEEGCKPAEARDVLPTNLATNLIITTNIRQWMYMIHRRCGPGDSNKMHEWCDKVRDWFLCYYPRVLTMFDYWYEKHPL